MKLSEYQTAAASTAMPEAFSHDYLIPMIVGEVGELFGQKAKAHWHGWSADQLQVELVSEYGDVCWGTAILLQMHGVTDLMYKHPTSSIPVSVWGNPLDPWHLLLQRVQHVHLWSTEEQTHSYIRGEAQQLWLALETFCQAITGVPFETVLLANLTKLASRAERGVLVGKGDHR